MNTIPITASINLKCIGGDTYSVSGHLELNDGLGPDLAVLEFPDLEQAPLHALANLVPQSIIQGLAIEGFANDGQPFNAQVELHRSISTGSNKPLRAEFILRGLSMTDLSLPTKEVVEWNFPLFNWKVHFCDIPSDYPDKGTKSLDRIELNLEGRTWTILDYTVGDRDALKGLDHHLPIKTASLSTPFESGDTEESISKFAEIICWLLSFALGRRINWTNLIGLDATGKDVVHTIQSRVTSPYNLRGVCSIDNFSPGVLCSFVEGAYPVFCSDPKWFELTIGYYTSTKLGQYVDVRAIILFILLDRITTFLSPKSPSWQFEENLKPRLDKTFREGLNDLLAQHIQNWTPEHTSRISSEILRWNNSLSYSAKVKESCKKLKIPFPSSDLLSQRHKLLHTGNLDEARGDLRDTWLDLDWLVLSMLLRIFKYSGPVFHPAVGAAPIKFDDAP